MVGMMLRWCVVWNSEGVSRSGLCLGLLKVCWMWRLIVVGDLSDGVFLMMMRLKLVCFRVCVVF